MELSKKLEKKLRKAARGKGIFCVWGRLKENHPVIYEVIQWGILALAVAALLHG